MRNVEAWRPTKFVERGGRLRASLDPREVGVASRLMADAVAQAYEQHLPTVARGRLVDLGCGKVPLYALYRDRVEQAICVDWPQSMHGGQHLDHECDLNQPLPFGEAEFDTVLLSDVLEHIFEPQELCAEVARVLRPGGHLVCNTPFHYWLHEVPHDFYRYTGFALRRLAQDAGLEVTVLVSTGGAGCVLADLVAKQAQRVPALGKTIAVGVQALARPRMRAVDPAPELFPFGYFMVARKP